MKTSGTHLICELSGCDPVKLASTTGIEQEMLAAAAAAHVLVLHGYVHQFAPTGVSGLLCLAESHLSIHTWPETGYAAVDIYTCGDSATPRKAVAHLAAALGAAHQHITEIARGERDASGHFVSAPAQPQPVAPDEPPATPGKPAPRKRFKPQPVD